MATDEARPLEGLRVLDFGHYVAGPLTAVMLADQGADVIHVDSPRTAATDADAFLLRNKRRITLDLKDTADLAIAEELVRRADVLIENFRPGVMDRLGLGYTLAQSLAPGLVYCSLPGFAPEDPRAGLPGFEGVIAAATGNTWIRTGQAPPGWDIERPTYTAVPVASNFAAFLAASAIVAALTARLRDGEGPHVSVPLFSAMFEAIGLAGSYETAKGLPPPRPLGGNGSGTYRCGDGRYVQFNPIGTSARFTRWLVDLADRTEWAADGLTDGLALAADPSLNEELCRRLAELFLTRSAKEWEDLAGPAGVPITMVRTVTEWAATDHALESREVAVVEDPIFGETTVAGFPVHTNGCASHEFRGRHLPDQDREAILAELAAPPRPQESRGGAAEQPYSGLKVVDLTEILAGPTSGKILAELGAEVVKINSPRSKLQSHGVVNRGKDTLLLDVESELGQQIFWKLVQDADVVVQNYPPGTADRYGIGYRHVAARNPDVVYVSVSCYGHGGEWEPRRGYETQGQAVSGVMDRAGGDYPPEVLGPYNVLDFGTGVMTSFACSLGIYQQAATGKGQHISASLAQTGTYHQATFLIEHASARHDEARGPAALGEGPLYRLYQGSDGWFFLALPREDAGRLGAIDGLGHIAGLLEGSDDELAAALEKAFATVGVADWVGALQAAGIGAHRVVPLAELMVDPEVIRQGLSITQVAEDVGEVRMPGVAMSLSRTPARLGKAVRRPGRDAPAVLERLGLADRLESYERAWVLRLEDGPTGW